MEEYFIKAQKNFLCNTSYPLNKENWLKYKVGSYDLFKNENDLNFYIHIPFCQKLCAFCEYVKYPKRSIELEEKYLKILENDISKFIEKHNNIILYGLDVGGGTPTSLDNGTFSYLMEICKKIITKLKTVEDFEPSIEGTFETIDEFKLKEIYEAGFRRISLGIQTMNLAILKKNNRKNLYNQYEYIYNKLIELGYNAHFGQNTFSKDKQDLGLSSYLRYRMIYNISYKGFGISAQSKSKCGMSYNVGKARKPLEECLKAGTFKEEDIYVLPKEELLAKFIAISMYYGKFKLSIMKSIIEENPLEYYKEEFEFLVKNNYVEISDDEVTITKKGFEYYSAIGALFYSKEVKKYMLGCEN